jgi:hypothetical protein
MNKFGKDYFFSVGASETTSLGIVYYPVLYKVVHGYTADTYKYHLFTFIFLMLLALKSLNNVNH